MAATDVREGRAGSVDGAELRERRLELRVLGPLEALSDGVARSRSAAASSGRALALLAADAGKVVATDELIDGVWGDEPTTAARSTLHTYISNLRQRSRRRASSATEAATASRSSREQVDAFVFEQEVSQARELAETDQAQAAQMLRQALALWRGHPYADVGRLAPARR